MPERCHECGAPVPHNETCQSNFHALLALEHTLIHTHQARTTTSATNNAEELGQVAHFYAVSCYAIQHPDSMGYTVDALHMAVNNLARHLEGNITLATIRHQLRAANNGKARVQRRAGDTIPTWPVKDWPITIADVLASPATLEAYATATTAWARATVNATINDIASAPS